ncbi:hypothetical protein N8612_00665 [Verrucomicrobia bacterium]|nr:hypothetical protein [Verrucomicrobiota bacterium]
MRGLFVGIVAFGISSAGALAVSITGGSFGNFYSGVDATFKPFSSPPGLATTDSSLTRQAWLAAFSGSPTVTTQNFDSGFTYGAVDASLANAPNPQTVGGYTFSFSFFTGNQSGVYKGSSGDPLELDFVSGPDSTRGFNVEEGQYSGTDRGYFQVKPNSTGSNDGGLKVDFGGTGVKSFGFYLTGREATKQDVNLKIEYVNSDVDTLSPTSAGTINIGGLGFIGYIGNGNEIANFKLEEVFSSGVGEDIFAIDGLETLTVVPEPTTWGFLSGFGVIAVALIRRRRQQKGQD